MLPTDQNYIADESHMKACVVCFPEDGSAVNHIGVVASESSCSSATKLSLQGQQCLLSCRQCFVSHSSPLQAAGNRHGGIETAQRFTVEPFTTASLQCKHLQCTVNFAFVPLRLRSLLQRCMHTSRTNPSNHSPATWTDLCCLVLFYLRASSAELNA
jgi:hypothetical protein